MAGDPTKIYLNPVEKDYIKQNSAIRQLIENAGSGNALSTIISVKNYGALGDGTTDDTAAIQAAFNDVFVQCTSNNDTLPLGNKGILYFPPGKYIITSPIQVNGLFGGVIIGAGRFSTQIFNTAGTSVIITNGCQYSIFRDLYFGTTGNTSRVIDLDFVGSGFCGLQSDTFINCFFDSGTIGVDIGKTDNANTQGSENLFLNCFWENNTTAGLKTSCDNALQNSVVGGDFQGCTGLGIWVNRGSVTNIVGCGFQNFSNTFDIQVDNSSIADGVTITSRTESDNFVNMTRGVASLINCAHTGSGIFANLGVHSMILNGCASNGTISGNNAFNKGQFDIIGCEFSQSHFANGGSGNDAIGRIRNSIYGRTFDGTGGTYVYDSMFRGSASDNGIVIAALRDITGDGNFNNGYQVYSINGGALGIVQALTRGGTATAQTIVQNGDGIGGFFFEASDGVVYQGAANINIEVDGVPSAGSIPGRIHFDTTPRTTTASTASPVSPVERMRIDNKGNVIINSAAISTAATDGFLYLDSCAGTPGGTPTSYTGRVPVVIDTSANKLWAYSSGAWRFTTLTT